MTTLMTWGNSDGIQGRCDDKCHSAKEPECHCMCGGRFHGAAHQPGGLKEAVKEFWNEVESEAEKRAVKEGMKLNTHSFIKQRINLLQQLRMEI